MVDISYVRYVERSALFAGLDRQALEEVTTLARLRRVQAGGRFFYEGDPAAVLYVLVEGRVKFTQVTPEGHSVLLRLVGPAEMFGTVAALGDARHAATAEAITACAALAWNSATIRGFMQRYPTVALNTIRFLAGRVAEFQDRYRELATQRVERRVANALLRLTRQIGRTAEGGVLIDLTLSRQDIAEMTGTTLFTASRILSGWEAQGIIETDRARILVRKLQALEAIADDLPPGNER